MSQNVMFNKIKTLISESADNGFKCTYWPDMQNDADMSCRYEEYINSHVLRVC